MIKRNQFYNYSNYSHVRQAHAGLTTFLTVYYDQKRLILGQGSQNIGLKIFG